MESIYKKMELILILFEQKPSYNKYMINDYIDYDSPVGFPSRAWNTANNYVYDGSHLLKRDDLKYINTVIKNLINHLGTNKYKITIKYIKEKIYYKSFIDEDELYLNFKNTYIALLDLMKK